MRERHLARVAEVKAAVALKVAAGRKEAYTATLKRLKTLRDREKKKSPQLDKEIAALESKIQALS
jgi:predicted transcriptional regulator